MTNEIPLIWTSKGNLPIADLRYETSWEVTPDYIKLIENYYDSTDELVKSSAHVYSIKPLESTAIQQSF